VGSSSSSGQGGGESGTKDRSAQGCADLKRSSKLMMCMITGDPHTLMFAGR
jgi:hypothetical protein